jgi:DnaJ-class molecular chaperone
LATKVLNPYAVLGVAADASMPTIKRAYRAQVKQHHPDMVATSDASASPRWCAILDALPFCPTRTCELNMTP